MVRHIRFTFLLNDRERKLLEELSYHLERTQSDVVRILIREASQILVTNLERSESEKLTKKIIHVSPK